MDKKLINESNLDLLIKYIKNPNPTLIFFIKQAIQSKLHNIFNKWIELG